MLLRGLGRTERVPTGEARLTAAVAARYAPGESLTAADVARYAARYGCWQGSWAHYLRLAAD